MCECSARTGITSSISVRRMRRRPSSRLRRHRAGWTMRRELGSDSDPKAGPLAAVEAPQTVRPAAPVSQQPAPVKQTGVATATGLRPRMHNQPANSNRRPPPLHRLHRQPIRRRERGACHLAREDTARPADTRDCCATRRDAACRAGPGRDRRPSSGRQPSR